MAARRRPPTNRLQRTALALPLNRIRPLQDSDIRERTVRRSAIGHSALIWVVSAVLLILVSYQLYRGLALRKVGVPGIFEVEFGELAPSDAPADGPALADVLTEFVESAAREASACNGPDRDCGLKKLAAERTAARADTARRIACVLDNDVRTLEDSIPPGTGEDAVLGLTTGQLQKFLEVRNSAMQIRQISTQAPFLPILPEIDAVLKVLQDNFGPPEILSPERPPTIARTLEGKRSQLSSLRRATKALRDTVHC